MLCYVDKKRILRSFVYARPQVLNNSYGWHQPYSNPHPAANLNDTLEVWTLVQCIVASLFSARLVHCRLPVHCLGVVA